MEDQNQPQINRKTSDYEEFEAEPKGGSETGQRRAQEAPREAQKKPTLLENWLGKPKAAARSALELARALVPIQVDPPGYESPRDSPGLGSPVTPSGNNDPTQLLAPTSARFAEGFHSALTDKECEHGPRGKSSEGPGLLTFGEILGTEVLPQLNLDDFGVSPEIMAMLQGTSEMEENVRGRRSEFLLLEGPEEKIPRKHEREDPSENSENGSGDSPPPKRSHEENFSPVDVDIPLLENLAFRGGEDPPAVPASVHAADSNQGVPQRPEPTATPEGIREGIPIDEGELIEIRERISGNERETTEHENVFRNAGQQPPSGNPED